MSKPIYTETQRFDQWWLHLIIAIACLSAPIIFAVAIYQQVIQGIQFGDEPMSDMALISFGAAISVLTVMIYVLFYYTKLEIKVFDDMFSFRFRPFMSLRAIAADEITKWSVEKYEPIKEYGGWGWRFSLKGKGWAYSVKGNRGLYIERKNGKKLMIGTQDPDKLAEAMRKMAPDKEYKS